MKNYRQTIVLKNTMLKMNTSFIVSPYYKGKNFT